MITVATKDVGDVKDKFKRELECVKTLEDRNEDYIKKEMGIYGRE
jgi:hypothetical protein